MQCNPLPEGIGLGRLDANLHRGWRMGLTGCPPQCLQRPGGSEGQIRFPLGIRFRPTGGTQRNITQRNIGKRLPIASSHPGRGEESFCHTALIARSMVGVMGRQRPELSGVAFFTPLSTYSNLDIECIAGFQRPRPNRPYCTAARYIRFNCTMSERFLWRWAIKQAVKDRRLHCRV